MTTIKTEGFCVPGNPPVMPRPHFHRPFSDGSMSIETDILTAIDQGNTGLISPFSFAHSLPSQPSLDQFITSPHSTSLDLDGHAFHLFNNFKVENPEPPVNFPMADTTEQRARSLSSTRNIAGGKAPPARRKLSMTDSRPPVSRGRPVHPHPRTMSHSDAFSGRFGLGIGLDTHKEGERTDSISPPEYNPYGIPIPPSGVWPSSAPSLVPGSFGSYSYTDEAIMDSPITPAQELTSNDSYKKQRRRECHNQVEKRRREHINSKIEELCQLLPAHYSQVEEAVEEEDEEEVASPAKKKKNKRSGSTTKQKDAAHCKGRILSQSVRYIHDLKQITEMQAARIQHLESLLPAMGQPGLTWPETAFASQPSGMTNQMVGSTEMMAFQPSPTEQSSASGNNLRRSSSLSAPESLEGMYDVKESDHSRRLSEVELQLSMSGMDMDSMMFGRREDRW